MSKTDFDNFVENFNIVDNALEQRQMMRWNGRDLRNRENLAEHSHLVVACVIEHIEEFMPILSENGYVVNAFNLIKSAMLHDGLELLRGDILSVTKDIIPNLRKYTDEEEQKFLFEFCQPLSVLENWILKLSDLKACYKFVEYELRYPNNDFAKEVYLTTKSKYDDFRKEFCEMYEIPYVHNDKTQTERFVKGYYDDVGVDVLLDRDVTLLPMSTQPVPLNVQVTPEVGKFAFLCARTSAAAKGLHVAMCPIDPNYTGNVIAIVSNISNKIVEYKKGEAFCQVVMTEFINNTTVTCKKKGVRSNGNLGSTGV